jgi:hypothetical protein
MEYLYLIRCDKFVKIGIACDVKNRLKTLQTGNPYQLALIDSFEFDEALRVESILHSKYDHARVRGEWFLLTDAELDELIDICRNFDESQLVISQVQYVGNVLESALRYCAEAGIRVELRNQGDGLVMIVHDAQYIDGKIVPMKRAEGEPA